MAPDGSFVVAWDSKGPSGQTNPYFRVFNADGSPRTTETSASVSSSLRFATSVAMDPVGNFAITSWSNPGNDTYIRRYNSAGTPLGPETVFVHSAEAMIDMDAAGNVVAVWTANDGAGEGVFAQQFDSTLSPMAPAFRVNQDTTGDQTGWAIAVDKMGNFVVAYGTDTGTASVRARAYSSAGIADNEVAVGFDETVQRRSESVAIAPNGDRQFVLVSGRGPVFAQRFATFPGSASVSGQVWQDVNGDGLRQTGESALSGTVVNLINAQGGIVDHTVTTAAGVYSFTTVAASQSEMVQFLPPGGSSTYIAAPPDVGSDDTVDSDIDQTTNRSAPFALANGSSLASVDAGFARNAAITGTVFLDSNPSGSIDTGDLGAGGFVVFVDRNANGTLDPGEFSTTTSIGGGYSIPGFLPGTYSVSVVARAGWAPPPSSKLVSIAPGAFSASASFAVQTNAIGPALAAVGTSFRADTPANATGGNAVATNDSGAVVIGWTDGTNSWVRLYDAAGTPTTAPIASGLRSVPRLAMAPNGNFVVANTGNPIQMRLFDQNGTALTGPIDVGNSSRDVSQIAMDDTGNFIICWTGNGDTVDGNSSDIFARRFAASGTPIGSAFIVNDYTAGDQYDPAVAMAGNGQFVVSWTDSSRDGDGEGVYARRFAADGSPSGSDFHASIQTAKNQQFSAVAMDDSGRFVIAWVSDHASLNFGKLQYRRYGSDGAALTGDISIVGDLRTSTPEVAMDNTGAAVFTYIDSDVSTVWAVKVNPLDISFGIIQVFRASYAPVSSPIALNSAGDGVVAWDGSGANARLIKSAPLALYGTPKFDAAGGPAGYNVRFSDDLHNSLSTSDLVLQNLATGAIVPSVAMAVSYDSTTNVATFTFPGLDGGILPSGSYKATISAGSVATDSGHALASDWTNRFLWITCAATGSSFRLRTGLSLSTLEVFDNSISTTTPAFSAPVSTLNGLLISGGPGDDAVEFDLGNNWYAPFSMPIRYDLGPQNVADTLTISGTIGGDNFTAGLDSVSFPVANGFSNVPLALPLESGGVERAKINGLSGNDVLTITATTSIPVQFNGGTSFDSLIVQGGNYVMWQDALAGTQSLSLTITNASVSSTTSQHLAGLSVGAGGHMDLTANGGLVLRAKSLSVAPTGRLDLADDSLIVDYTSTTPLGSWNGASYTGLLGLLALGQAGTVGIVSSSRAADTTTLGAAEASQVFGITGTQTGSFRNEVVDATTVLVGYTYGGDANLDGAVDVSDLGILATAWQSTGAGFGGGDFNYDGNVDVGDLGILATNWQKSLVPGATMPAWTGAPFRERSVRSLESESVADDVLG